MFIDTSNKKLVLAIINQEKEIVDFFIKDSNNDMVKNALDLIEKFIKKNKLNIEDFSEYMITTGPGSFTGVKVAINIVRSLNMVNKIEKIHTINTFDLLSEKNNTHTAISFGKDKFYLKNNKKTKVKVATKEDIKEIENITIDYEHLTKEFLQEKINNKSFKILDNLNKVKIKYLTNF